MGLPIVTLDQYNLNESRFDWRAQSAPFERLPLTPNAIPLGVVTPEEEVVVW